MITPSGYSKDPSIKPEGIVITWGKDLVIEKGGLLQFIKFFESEMQTSEDLWLQKCAHKPLYDDLLYVYIIVCNQLRYRCFYGGYQTGVTKISEGSWSSRTVIGWPRIVCGGPFLKAPYKIPLKGFQGFRYCTKMF